MSVITTGSSTSLFGIGTLITLVEALAAVEDNETTVDNKTKLKDQFELNNFNQEEFKIKNEFETAFMDAKILQKTLQEHGCTDFQFYENNFFTCTLEGMHLEFSKENENLPYKMLVKCNENELLQAFCDELSEEYTGNTQEETYNKIKDRLKEKNLEISQEELLEDDSIVLTINLD